MGMLEDAVAGGAIIQEFVNFITLL
jgi:hypothetical protein